MSTFQLIAIYACISLLQQVTCLTVQRIGGGGGMVEQQGHYNVQISRGGEGGGRRGGDSGGSVTASVMAPRVIDAQYQDPSWTPSISHHGRPEWSTVGGDEGNANGMGNGMGMNGGGRPAAPGNELVVANPSIAQKMYYAPEVFKAAMGSQDPDLDGEVPGPALDRDGKPSQTSVQPMSMPNRLAKIANQWEYMGRGAANMVQATYNAGIGAVNAGQKAIEKISGGGGDKSWKAQAMGVQNMEQQQPEGNVNMMAPGQQQQQQDSGSAGVEGSYNQESDQVSAIADKTSMTADMGTAAVFAGLRGAFKHPHRDKQLVGSTLRRAQKSLAGNGFDHTNGQYGVPTAMGTSGLGGGQNGIFKPDYGPFGLGPTKGVQFNLGAQPMGSQFQNPVQQGLEANREAINDMATMPQALSGMMGMPGLAMGGNPMRNKWAPTIVKPMQQ